MNIGGDLLSVVEGQEKLRFCLYLAYKTSPSKPEGHSQKDVHSGSTQSPFLFLLVWKRLLFLFYLSRDGAFFYPICSERMAFSSFNNGVVKVRSCMLEVVSRDLHMLASKAPITFFAAHTKARHGFN